MKTIRFLGGPADQKIMAVQNDETFYYIYETPSNLLEEIKILSLVGAASLTPKTVCYIYQEAFRNSAYFKYQGVES